MKRAIYLDERERELTRRVLKHVTERLSHSILGGMAVEKLAVRWTIREILVLMEKFKEPDPAMLIGTVELRDTRP